MPPTTPKLTKAQLEDALLLARDELRDAQAMIGRLQQRIEAKPQQESDPPDTETLAISGAVKALEAIRERPRLSGPYEVSGVDFERILRYLAARLGVRWPEQVKPQPVEVMLGENTFAGTMLVVDPATGQILHQRREWMT